MDWPSVDVLSAPASPPFTPPSQQGSQRAGVALKMNWSRARRTPHLPSQHGRNSVWQCPLAVASSSAARRPIPHSLASPQYPITHSHSQSRAGALGMNGSGHVLVWIGLPIELTDCAAVGCKGGRRGRRAPCAAPRPPPRCAGGGAGAPGEPPSCALEARTGSMPDAPGGLGGGWAPPPQGAPGCGTVRRARCALSAPDPAAPSPCPLQLQEAAGGLVTLRRRPWPLPAAARPRAPPPPPPPPPLPPLPLPPLRAPWARPLAAARPPPRCPP
jgi:hypothetical protein